MRYETKDEERIIESLKRDLKFTEKMLNRERTGRIKDLIKHRQDLDTLIHVLSIAMHESGVDFNSNIKECEKKQKEITKNIAAINSNINYNKNTGENTK